MRIARTIIYLVIGDLIHGHIHTIMHYHYARVLLLSRVIAISPLMLWNLFEDTQHILYPTCVHSLSRMITIVGVKYILCTSPMYLYATGQRPIKATADRFEVIIHGLVTKQTLLDRVYKYMLHTFGPILVYACFPPGIK